MTNDSITIYDRKDQADVELLVTALSDGTFSLTSISGVKASVLEVTPTLDTSAFAIGDVMSDTVEVVNAVSALGGTSLLHSFTVLDKDDQAGAFDVVFLRTNVSLGTKNAAVSISDANAVEILGVISIGSGDYVDFVGSQVATVSLAGLALSAGAASSSIYMSLISRDAKTYTASGLVFKLGLAKG